MMLWKKLFNTLLTGDTKVASKGSIDIEGTFKIGGTTLNSTADELNRSTDASTRIVSTSATSLSLTVAAHGERVLLVNTNSTVANTFTLPVATGSGVKFTVINNIAQTQGSVVVAANGTTDVVKGVAVVVSSTEEAAAAFLTSATSDKITLNAGTSGGLGYDTIECWDSAANVWNVRVSATGNGSLATPFAAT